MGSESRVNGNTILWLTNLGNSPSGLSIRHTHFGRNLKKRGYKVHLLVPECSYDARELDAYRKLGVIDGCSVFPGYNASGLKGLLSRFAIHPALRNFFRHASQREVTSVLEAFVKEHQPATLLISERVHLFAVRKLQTQVRVAIDWCDSFTLNCYREFKRAFRAMEVRPALRSLYELISTALDESYYPRFANVNLVICDPDREVFQRLSQGTEFAVLKNGIDHFTSPLTPRTGDSLIFSGVMNFPPNYHSALWFIDHVLPLVRRRRPRVQFIVAGRDPVDELRARANEFIKVTGQVPDLNKEIAGAQLYVAPMIAGGGFKNKVIEAFAAGTPVVGTHLAAEFLPDTLRNDMILAEGAADLAEAVVRCLENPAPLLGKVNHAQDILRRHYSWDQCTDHLLSCLSAHTAGTQALAVGAGR